MTPFRRIDAKRMRRRGARASMARHCAGFGIAQGQPACRCATGGGEDRPRRGAGRTALRGGPGSGERPRHAATAAGLFAVANARTHAALFATQLATPFARLLYAHARNLLLCETCRTNPPPRRPAEPPHPQPKHSHRAGTRDSSIRCRRSTRAPVCGSWVISVCGPSLKTIAYASHPRTPA